jgi:hypothetical protein
LEAAWSYIVILIKVLFSWYDGSLSEMIMQEVKKLAFSPVMESEMWDRLRPAAEKIFRNSVFAIM